MLLVPTKLLRILITTLLTIQKMRSCPYQYNNIAQGCYKINNGSNITWSSARDICQNDTAGLPSNGTVPNGISHLVALEQATEKSALFYWMNAYRIEGEFWIDGLVQSSTWDWSKQSIVWYFNSFERNIVGNGSNYKIVYNVQNTSYRISDDISSQHIHFICEYQGPCNQTNRCQNNASCYLNAGHEICICAPGFTGDDCQTEIDECLSAPCLHGGKCLDGLNNYSCNCSEVLFTGPNCEIQGSNPKRIQRLAAFWSVLGVVASFIVLLTLSDLPWGDIVMILGCSDQLCCKRKAVINENNSPLSSSPANISNWDTTNTPLPYETVGQNQNHVHVIDTVYNDDLTTNVHSTDNRHSGSRSLDQNTMINSTYLSQEKLNPKRIYVDDVNETKQSTSVLNDPVRTMINWAQQLQDELRNKRSDETKADSPKPLIGSAKT